MIRSDNCQGTTTDCRSLADICSSRVVSSPGTARKVALCAPPTVRAILLECAIAAKATMWIQMFFRHFRDPGQRLYITPACCSVSFSDANERAVYQERVLEICRSRHSWFKGYDRVSKQLTLDVVMAALNGMHMWWASAASEHVENIEVDFTAVSVQHYSDTLEKSLDAFLRLAKGKFPGRLPQDYVDVSMVHSNGPTLTLPAPFSISLNIVNVEEQRVGEFLTQAGHLRSIIKIEHIDCSKVTLPTVVSMVTLPNCLKFLQGLTISLCNEKVVDMVKFFTVLGRSVRLLELKVVLLFDGKAQSNLKNGNLVSFLTGQDGLSSCVAMQTTLQCLTVHYSPFEHRFSYAVAAALVSLVHPLKSLTLEGGRLKIPASDFCTLLQNQCNSICQLFISAEITALQFDVGEKFTMVAQYFSACTNLAVLSFEVPDNCMLIMEAISACPNIETLQLKSNRNILTNEFLQIGRILSHRLCWLRHCFLHFGPGKLLIDMIAVRDGKLEELNHVLASIIGDREPDEAIQTLIVSLQCPRLLQWLQDIRPNVNFALC